MKKKIDIKTFKWNIIKALAICQKYKDCNGCPYLTNEIGLGCIKLCRDVLKLILYYEKHMRLNFDGSALPEEDIKTIKEVLKNGCNCKKI